MQTIVVGVDGSGESLDALRWAQALARRNQAVVKVVTAWMIPAGWGAGGTGASVVEQLEEGAKLRLRESLEAVPADGVDRVGETSLGVSVSGGLIAAASEADLLVVGTRAHSRFERVVGSVAIQCAQYAQCPFVAVPKDAPPLGELVAVAYDGSDSSRAALEWAAQVTAAADMGLRVIAVWERAGWSHDVVAHDPVDPEDRAVEELKRAVASVVPDAAERAEYRPVHGPEKVAPYLLEAAEDASMLVVGSRGRGGFTGLLLGSVSQRCLEASPIAVAVIRG